MKPVPRCGIFFATLTPGTPLYTRNPWDSKASSSQNLVSCRAVIRIECFSRTSSVCFNFPVWRREFISIVARKEIFFLFLHDVVGSPDSQGLLAPSMMGVDWVPPGVVFIPSCVSIMSKSKEKELERGYPEG